MSEVTIRKCPVCHILLRRVSLCENIEIEICQSCRGIWFDKEEIDHAYKTPQLPPLFLSERRGLRDPIVCIKCKELNSRSIRKCGKCGFHLAFLCPYCKHQLEEVRVGDVIADRCNQCRGVWLDGGELVVLFNFYKRSKSINKRDSYAQSTILPDTLDTLEFLFWTIHFSDAGGILIDAAAHAPEVVGGLIKNAGQIPELAGHVFDGTANVAGHVVDVSGELLSGAVDVASNIPEVAASAADVCAGFLETLLGFIAEIFD
jgi:Zn-finger nucleic acid-binding protein